MLGILLAGGLGTRLGPITKVLSKQLLPIYDKPMIFYPISLLMAAGITEVILITTPRDQDSYRKLLGDGRQWGIAIHYLEQPHPNGLPEAFLLSAELIAGRSCTLMLGDNIIYGSQIGRKIAENLNASGASIYGYLVNDISAFGSVILDSQGKAIEIKEKPIDGGKGLAIPGIYHFDETVVEKSSRLEKSSRGELEIVDLLNLYLSDNNLDVTVIDRGIAWLDTGTIEDLAMASELVRVVQSRQGMLIGSPEEVAFRKNLINSAELENLASNYGDSLYGRALREILLEK
jgi:glucose-1-phosphate thymidylyltransferase